jgi:hypothetical protein
MNKQPGKKQKKKSIKVGECIINIQIKELAF